jgi:hypothetical protein
MRRIRPDVGGFMALSGTENLGVCAEQEESDIADVDSDEESVTS